MTPPITYVFIKFGMFENPEERTRPANSIGVSEARKCSATAVTIAVPKL